MKMTQVEIMSGELLVCGKDMLQIELKHGKPDTVLVEFKHNHISTPCNPHNDHLSWEIHDRHHGLVLVIKWHVASAREIIWAISLM